MNCSMKNPSSKTLRERLKGRNLYLIGMMGSGKSTTGRPLSQAINYGFVDLDKVIEQVCDKSIQKIFEDEGENNFRSIENQILNEIGQRHSLIVSTGGGVITRSENWGILHQGIVIWLNTDKNIILARLKEDLGKRPLLEGKDTHKVLDQLYKDRVHIYAEADLEIVVSEESPEEIAQIIINKLPSILKDEEEQGAQQTTSM